jgi:hypothetical protein
MTRAGSGKDVGVRLKIANRCWHTKRILGHNVIQVVVRCLGSFEMRELEDLDVILRRKDGMFMAIIPSLYLYATGETEAAALAAIGEKRRQIRQGWPDDREFQDLRGSFAPNGEARRGQSGSLGQFSLKCAIAALVGTLAVMLLLLLIGFVAESRLRHARPSAQQIALVVETLISRAADPDSDLSEQRKQRILADMRTIADKWRPFLNELSDILGRPVPQPNQNAQ